MWMPVQLPSPRLHWCCPLPLSLSTKQPVKSIPPPRSAGPPSAPATNTSPFGATAMLVPASFAVPPNRSAQMGSPAWQVTPQPMGPVLGPVPPSPPPPPLPLVLLLVVLLLAPPL